MMSGGGGGGGARFSPCVSVIPQIILPLPRVEPCKSRFGFNKIFFSLKKFISLRYGPIR